jgi:hypothetical protein
MYAWYTRPDEWEFGVESDTYRIISDVHSRWNSATDQVERNRLYSVADEARRMHREDTRAVYKQGEVESILSDMQSEANMINRKLMYTFMHDSTGLAKAGAKMLIFANLVRTDGKYDLKNKSKWQYKGNTYHGNEITDTDEWNINQVEFMYYDGRLWSSEQLGNYTFGYFGAAYGYIEEFLCFGAGVYQKGTDPNPEWTFGGSYWDDPRDQVEIRLGYHKYFS